MSISRGKDREINGTKRMPFQAWKFSTGGREQDQIDFMAMEVFTS